VAPSNEHCRVTTHRVNPKFSRDSAKSVTITRFCFSPSFDRMATESTDLGAAPAPEPQHPFSPDVTLEGLRCVHQCRRGGPASRYPPPPRRPPSPTARQRGHVHVCRRARLAPGGCAAARASTCTRAYPPPPVVPHAAQPGAGADGGGRRAGGAVPVARGGADRPAWCVRPRGVGLLLVRIHTDARTSRRHRSPQAGRRRIARIWARSCQTCCCIWCGSGEPPADPLPSALTTVTRLPPPAPSHACSATAATVVAWTWRRRRFARWSATAPSTRPTRPAGAGEGPRDDGWAAQLARVARACAQLAALVAQFATRIWRRCSPDTMRSWLPNSARGCAGHTIATRSWLRWSPDSARSCAGCASPHAAGYASLATPRTAGCPSHATIHAQLAALVARQSTLSWLRWLCEPARSWLRRLCDTPRIALSAALVHRPTAAAANLPR
jgi:hypothetical protein